MKISTEEFLHLVQDRPALWQKSHPGFANRDIRNQLLHEVGLVAGMTVMDCSKKLKNLKDSMRIQVAKLPKTKSGLPAFNLRDNITWPLFKCMMFMKDEFVGRKRISSLECDGNWGDVSEMVDKYEAFSPSSEELSADQSASSYALMLAATQADNSNQSWNSSTSSSIKKIKKRRCSNPSQTDFEERRLAVLEKVVATDEMETFALDIANDLRKIINPVKLMKAKASIRRITEEFVLSELLPSIEVSTSTNYTNNMPTTVSPSHESQSYSQCS